MRFERRKVISDLIETFIKIMQRMYDVNGDIIQIG